MRSFTFALAVFCLLSGAAFADVIQLSNGDRITGTIITTAGDKITVKTEFLGEIRIDRKAIVAIKTEEPLVVTFEDGEQVEGTIATEESEVVVVPEGDGRVVRDLAAIRAVRNVSSQAEHERELERQTDPGLLDFWAVSADLGLAAAQGNAETTTINAGAAAERVTGFDKTILEFQQIYSTQQTTEPFGATANSITGLARYERNFGDRFFAFSSATFDFDEFQDLDLRSVLGGGLGWRILDSERHKWNFNGGGNWNREKFSTGLLRNSGEVSLGEDSEHQLSSMLRVHQSISFFPNLSDTGQYRFRGRAGANLKLNNHLAVTFLISNRYLSNPVAGNQKNDLLYSTGLQFNWAQR